MAIEIVCNLKQRLLDEKVVELYKKGLIQGI